MNYTQGEWVKEGSFIFSSEKSPRLIAEVIRPNMSYLEQQANAHLIAASPRMVEALQAVFDEVTSGECEDFSPQVRAIVANALRKARGS